MSDPKGEAAKLETRTVPILLFPAGRIEPPKPPPPLPRYGVIAYWSRGWPHWEIFDKWWIFDGTVEEIKAKAKADAEAFAQTKTNNGWQFCQLILFKGIE